MRLSLALVVLFAACTKSPRTAPTAARDAGAVTDANHAVAQGDPCDLRATIALPLRASTDDRRPATVLPVGAAMELLAVTEIARGSLAHLGVLSRVRTSGAEGFVLLRAEDVTRCQASRPLPPGVRESRVVMVDGVAETWRVRFVTPSRAPAPFAEDAWSCPGEFDARFDQGEAVLERLRDGVVIDAFRGDEAPVRDPERVLPRLRVPWRAGPRGATSAERERLPWVTVMDVGDYDHDGRATEFATEAAYLSCGHTESVLVGITRDRPRLHLLAWSNGERMALSSHFGDWESIRARDRGEIVLTACGDHGATAEERLRWWPQGGRLAAEEIRVEMTEDCQRPDVATSGR